MKFDAVSLLFLFGAVLSLLMLIGININKPLFSDLKKITSILLFTMMITMSYYIVLLNRFENIYAYIGSLGMAAWMAITPLFYLLCRCILDPRWMLSWKHLVFFPLSLMFIIEGVLTSLGFEVWIFDLIGDEQLFLDLWMSAFFISSLFFIWKSILLIRAQEEDRNKELTWFAYLFFGTLVIFGTLYLFMRPNYVEEFEMVLILLFEVFVFVLVYRIFKIMPFQHLFDMAKEENNGIAKEQLGSLASKLEQTMRDEKPYLDKKLSLNLLSQLSKINTSELSQLFSIYYKSNFYEFINKHRLVHLEKMILDPDYDQYKITALAEESGFNSKATFYKAFKEKHQLTPSQFIKRYRKKSIG